MILEAIMTESTKVADCELVQHSHYSLTNPLKRVFRDMRDETIKQGREYLEVSMWQDVESCSTVVAVKSIGLEKWE